MICYICFREIKEGDKFQMVKSGVLEISNQPLKIITKVYCDKHRLG